MMTCRLMRGFDHENNYVDIATNGVAYAQDNAGHNAARVTGRFGGGAIQFGAYVWCEGFSFPLGGSTVVTTGNPVYVGCALSGISASGFACIGVRSNGGNMHCSVVVTPTTITAYRNGAESLITTPFNNSSTSLGSVSYTWPSSGWLYIEVEFIVASGTGGSIIVRVGGSSTATLSVTGVNTLGDTSNTGIEYVFIGAPHAMGSGNTDGGCIFDDLYCVDSAGSANNSFLGERQVVTLFPTANVSVGFTPLTGSNYTEVSETTFDGDTSYNYAGSSGLTDIFNHGTLSSSFSTINAVQLCCGARKDSTGTAAVENYLSSSGTTETGSALTLTTSYQYQCDIFETDPHTSAAWTVSGVNAAEIGYTRST